MFMKCLLSVRIELSQRKRLHVLAKRTQWRSLSALLVALLEEVETKLTKAASDSPHGTRAKACALDVLFIFSPLTLSTLQGTHGGVPSPSTALPLKSKN